MCLGIRRRYRGPWRSREPPARSQSEGGGDHPSQNEPKSWIFMENSWKSLEIHDLDSFWLPRVFSSSTALLRSSRRLARPRGAASVAPDVPSHALPTPVSPGIHRTAGESRIDLFVSILMNSWICNKLYRFCI